MFAKAAIWQLEQEEEFLKNYPRYKRPAFIFIINGD